MSVESIREGMQDLPEDQQLPHLLVLMVDSNNKILEELQLQTKAWLLGIEKTREQLEEL